MYRASIYYANERLGKAQCNRRERNFSTRSADYLNEGSPQRTMTQSTDDRLRSYFTNPARQSVSMVSGVEVEVHSTGSAIRKRCPSRET
jgi:hypothetical protein